MASIAEILELSPEDRRAAYAVVNKKDSNIDISSVWIKTSETSGDVMDDFSDKDKFTNYGTYSFVWQKTLKETPERSDSGALPQLRNIPYFITGNLKIDFDMISIDDYRRIMKLIYTGNNCYKVKAYDIVYNRMVILEMYFQPEDLPKIYTITERLQGSSNDEWTDLIGVQNHTVQMIGTGNDNVQGRYDF